MPENNVIPLTSDNDAWHKAVALLTGYEAPLRHTLFDKLLGNEGIKQMKVEISKQRSVDYVDPNDFNWRVENAGYSIENTDFVIPFYMTGGDDPSAGDKVSMYKARITMLGNKSNDGPPAGGVVEGSEFKSQYENHLGLSGDKATWTTAPLTQYAYGTGRALEALLNNDIGTHGFSWNGINVADEKAVTLKSFDTAAAAFDRVAQFFSDRQKTVEEWQRRVGVDQDDAWRGQAAGVFWHLIDTINRQYEGFAKDMSAAGGRSKQGNELREAGSGFRNSVLKLHSSWANWELYMGNPLRWLHDLLVEITDHVWENNIKQITYKVNSGARGSYYTTYHAKAGFDQTATRFGKGDNFGQLDDLSTWKAVGDRAVENWQASVIENLVKPANAALDEIHNKWNSKNIDLGSVRTRGDDDLTSSYTEDKNEKKEEEAENAAAEANRKNDEFMAWQKAEAERAKAEAERKEKEQEAKEAAAKAEQERKEAEAKAEQERKEKEAEAKEAAAKAEQEKKEAEAEAKAEQKEKEAEQKQAEAEAKAEQKEAEAKAEQEQKEKEAEQKQAEAEAKAEQKEAEQEAKQEEAQRKQDEAQARAEQLQISQFNQSRADQDAARKEQEKKQAEAEAKAEQKQAEQEAKQEQKEKEAEQKQAEAEAKAEQKEAEQEKKQAEAEAEAEAKQKEQEEEQRRLQTEQELRQEQLLTEQEKKEAEAQAKQEEAQKRQEAAWQQAQAEYQQSTEGQLTPTHLDLPDSGDLSLGSGDLNAGDLDALAPDQNPYSGDTLTNPGGSVTHLDDSGRLVTEYPDGSSVRIDPDLHTATVTQPDGTVQTGPLNVGDLLPNPDGSVTHLDSGGNIVTEYPDGTTTTVDPHTGIGTTTRPDGTVTSGHLNGSAGDLPSVPGLNSGSSSLHPSYTSPAYDYGSYEEELFDDSPYESPYATQASTGAAASAADIGTPLNTGSLPGGLGTGGMGAGGMPMGGMPMGGMGGMGGSGNQSQSERVRNVIDDGQVVNGRGGRYGANPAARAVQEENNVRVSTPRTSATTSSSPFLPMGGSGAPGGQPQTQTGDRARDAWVQEDDDVWGTDEGGAPAVIGR